MTKDPFLDGGAARGAFVTEIPDRPPGTGAFSSIPVKEPGPGRRWALHRPIDAREDSRYGPERSPIRRTRRMDRPRPLSHAQHGVRAAPVRIAAAAVAVAALVTAAVTSRFAFVGIALVPLFFLATSFGQPARLTESLRAFVGRRASVRVWGEPLSPGRDGVFEVASVKALGAGLHLYLRGKSPAAPTHLKVAQPRDVAIAPTEVVIGKAAYVQWAGRKLKPAPGAKALVIVLE